VLLKRDVLDAIATGRVSVVYRRWRRPGARAGGSQRTAIGVLAVGAVDIVEAESITELDAALAGYPSPEALLASLRQAGAGDLYRVELRLAGEDPRAMLRDRPPDAGEMVALAQRLDQMDSRATCGPWTRQTLGMIAAAPGVLAARLAEQTGRPTLAFKSDVRKLKELGLTESLEVGYRLLPRGHAVLQHLSR